MKIATLLFLSIYSLSLRVPHFLGPQTVCLDLFIGTTVCLYLFTGIKGHLFVCNSWGTCPGRFCNTNPTNSSV